MGSKEDNFRHANSKTGAVVSAGCEANWQEELRDWPAQHWPEHPVRPAAPSRQAVLHVRWLIAFGSVTLAAFYFWLFAPEQRGDFWLFWLFALGMLYRGVGWAVEWQYYARPKFEPFVAPARPWTVDVLTTACPGEPRGMILRTLLAMRAIRYPHKNYLCDEGDDPVLRAACRQLGVEHVTRQDRKDAKAGNINHALTNRCGGEIAVVLDPDHEPAPYLLDRVLGYFEDPKIGFVQSVQAYRNENESLVANGAAKQTYLFYGPTMLGMNAYGVTQAIGANCVFRRAALDSIGGHAAGLAEDMHTSMQLYAKGWRSVYVPEVLTRGLVPNTLAAYCKQQLKWACGAFDLLFRQYPKLWRGFTLWQRLHYSVAPLYFLCGLFVLLDIVLPIICLAFGVVAVRTSIPEFFLMAGPPLVVVFCLRQMVQHWCIEERERGFHLIGSLLNTGCWSVFLAGFLCALCRLKVPYIPTAKHNVTQDSWGLALPNLAAAAASLAAVFYGLRMDWTPFNQFMAVLALGNAAQLIVVASIGQQLTLSRFAAAYPAPLGTRLVRRWVASGVVFFHGLARIGMFRWPALIALGVVAAMLSINVGLHLQNRGLRGQVEQSIQDTWAHLTRRPLASAAKPILTRDTGGFYVGADLPGTDGGVYPPALKRLGEKLGTHFRLFPFRQSWGPESLAHFPAEAMRQARSSGAVPLITWTPLTHAFPEWTDDPQLGKDRGICSAIARGVFDDYLTRYAEKMRDYADPVLLNFAPEPDNPLFLWSASAGTTPADYVQAWRHAREVFYAAGASNVGWVWSTASPTALRDFFPGQEYVDWIGVKLSDDGANEGKTPRDFAEFYRPFRDGLQPYSRPVLVTGITAADKADASAGWIGKTLAAIAADFPEIRGLVLSGSGADWAENLSEQGAAALKQGLARATLSASPSASSSPGSLTEPWLEKKRAAYVSPFVTGSPGHFQLRVDGQPFYIRGVAYNPGHDWRDGNSPLTRRQLTEDFTRIRAMGANTIRRYIPGRYDYNILRVAGEQNLKVLYGFWFVSAVDYLTDAATCAEYQREVEENVRRWRDEPSILAWSLGNEVWGQSRHTYAQPYLTEVRHAYLDFMEKLARRVHELDPNHPVFIANSRAADFAGGVVDAARGVPGIDFVGYNVFYEPNLAGLDRVAAQFDPGRPYLLSEFGPDAFWDENLTKRTRDGSVIEPNSLEKSAQYVNNWQAHVATHRGANIGGVAFCWRDRFEGTASWFGLTDFAGLPKPTYFALENAWTGRRHDDGVRIIELDGPASATAAVGSTVTMQAGVENDSRRNLTFRWLLATEIDGKVFRYLAKWIDGATTQVTLPYQPGKYRVYLNVNDGLTADEANFALTAVARSVGGAK